MPLLLYRLEGIHTRNHWKVPSGGGQHQKRPLPDARRYTLRFPLRELISTSVKASSSISHFFCEFQAKKKQRGAANQRKYQHVFSSQLSPHYPTNGSDYSVRYTYGTRVRMKRLLASKIMAGKGSKKRRSHSDECKTPRWKLYTSRGWRKVKLNLTDQAPAR